ncbi:MAG: prephenate dehydrogenase/arogenate dehydrogenase family protein [Desulfosarcinaceae bacterium]
MIGLIGYGRFGRLSVRHLAQDFKVVVHTREEEKRQGIARAGGRLVSLAEACGQDIVILCVPISAMQSTLQTIAPLLSPGALVVDVCSVKVLPVQWMTDSLPETVEILATHPMFGPDSAAASLQGHKIVLCPHRIEEGRFSRIKSWLQGKGLNTLETTADEHDRQIAVSLALTHFIGRSLSQFGAKPLEIDTEGYKRLLHILGVVTNDTWQLFRDMNRYNPYAKEKREMFLQAIQEVNEGLQK